MPSPRRRFPTCVRISDSEIESTIHVLSLAVTAGTEITLNFNADMSGLSNGLHVLYVRGKDSNEKWAIFYSRPFVKEAKGPADAAPTVVALEYFADGDPGLGQGTQVTITPATDLVQAFQADLSSLPHRLHVLYIRARNEEGKWSILHR